MTDLAVRTARSPADIAALSLPRWPVLAMLGGLPLWWISGLNPFVPAVFTVVLGAVLLAAPTVRLVPGVLPLVLFALWCPATAVMLDSPLRAVGFAIRWSGIVAAVLLLLYLTNCHPQRFRDLDVLKVLAVAWGMVVVGGYLGLTWPEMRLVTPTAHVLPSAVLNNELVRDLVMPRFAEVQRPWGAPEAFSRPSAPFPYTNGWGCALALLTPVVLTLRDRLQRPASRAVILVGIVVSMLPAAESGNRGMLLVLGVEVAWYLGIQLVRRGLAAVWRALLLAAAATTAMAGLGVFGLISQRQSYSDTTTGRASVYSATWAEVGRSPVLGFGAPRPSAEIGISLGTQGAFWMYLFSYGFVGVALFLVFLAGVVVRTLSLSADHAWLQSVIVGALVACWFYGFDAVHWSIIAATAALLLRTRAATAAVAGHLALRARGFVGGYTWR